jgi:hypothetical protein
MGVPDVSGYQRQIYRIHPGNESASQWYYRNANRRLWVLAIVPKDSHAGSLYA